MVRAALPAVVASFALVAACSNGGGDGPGLTVGEPDTRLEARPDGGGGNCAPGVHELELQQGRKAMLRVTPPGRRTRRGLLLALHGAGSGGAQGGLHVFRSSWDTPGLVLVAPAAAGNGWSLEEKDVGFVDRALERAFARCRIDPRRVAVGGFSSGAGIALRLGLTNGDLLRHVISLSPGGGLPRERVGKPSVFLAHGTRDGVIPIGSGADPIARELREDGYDVTYRRFEGGHRVLPELAAQAVQRALVP